jgi:N-acetylmuramoyl-L-alanine amidase
MTFRALLGRCLIPMGAACIAVFFSGCAGTPTSMRPGSFSTVVIDAGHGGKDNGARSRSGLMEKTAALDTAQRLQSLLRREGFRTVMTRNGDYFVELDDRVSIANRYAPNAILVSVHYNASPSSSPSGAEVFFWRSDSYGLARRVERHIAAESSLDYRGATRRVLRLTHNPRIPSILCECGFLTNGGDAARISSSSFRQRIAEGIADGIIEQHDRGDAGIGSLPSVRNDSRRRIVRRQPARVTHRRVVRRKHGRR